MQKTYSSQTEQASTSPTADCTVKTVLPWKHQTAQATTSSTGHCTVTTAQRSVPPILCHCYKHGIRIPSQDRSRSQIVELRQKHLGIYPVGAGGSNGSGGAGNRMPSKSKK